MSEENTVPSAEASAPEPMTFDSALAQLNAADEPETQEQQTQETTEEPAGDEVEDATQAEASDEPEADANPEPTDEPEEAYAHGNTRTRLRDGTVTTVGELKKAAEEARELRAQQQAIEAQKAKNARQQAYFAEQQALIAQAKAVLESRLPEKPDPELARTDPVEYTIKMAEFNAAYEQHQQLEQAEQANRAAAAKKQKEALDAHMQKQSQLLRERRPHFSDPVKAEAVWKDMTTIGCEAYGFTPEEFQKATDHRVVMMAEDAIAYRKLMAQKPKALEKAKDAPPVANPGRRVSTTERQTQSVEEGMQRLRTTGSFDDALKILNAQS